MGTQKHKSNNKSKSKSKSKSNNKSNNPPSPINERIESISP